MPDPFFTQIDAQLDRIAAEKPTDFAGLRTILLDPSYDAITTEVSRNGVRDFDDREAFFAGSGGDCQLVEVLVELPGWSVSNSLAPNAAPWPHCFHAVTPAGEHVDYIEGDLEMTPPLTDNEITGLLADIEKNPGPANQVAARALLDLQTLRRALRARAGDGWVSGWTCKDFPDADDVKDRIDDLGFNHEIDPDAIPDVIQEMIDKAPDTTCPALNDNGERTDTRVPAGRYTVLVPDTSALKQSMTAHLAVNPEKNLLFAALSDLPGMDD